MVPPLTSVQFVLSHAAVRVASLAHVADLISSLHDFSPCVTPARAAASGFVFLFQRVFARELVAHNDDPLYREWVLSLSFEAAICGNHLTMVQFIHDLHPGPLEVSVLQLAIEHGSFEMLQWVIAHRADPMGCAVGADNLCRGYVNHVARSVGEVDTFRVASWLMDEGLMAVRKQFGVLTEPVINAMLKSAELLRWCDAQGWVDDAAMHHSLVVRAIAEANDASEEIVRDFLNRDTGYARNTEFLDRIVDSLVRASCVPGWEALVFLVLDHLLPKEMRHHFVYAPIREGGKRVLQWSREYEDTRTTRFDRGMSYAIQIAARLGHWDTMRWLMEERSVTSLMTPTNGVAEQDLLAIMTWLHEKRVGQWSVHTMNNAASNGHLQVVAWLHRNRIEGCSTNAMDWAACNGHLQVVQWLHENRSEGCTIAALNQAAWAGHLDVVQWLQQNRTEGNVSAAMAYAAANGRLDMLPWFLEHHGCASCVYRDLLAVPQDWCGYPTKLSPRLLYTLQWLRARRDTPAIACGGRCTNADYANYKPNLASVALGSGDALLLKYLHVHHSELFTSRVFRLVDRSTIQQGHLAIFQWLYEHYPDCVDWDDLANDTQKQKGNEEVAAWLQHAILRII